MSKQTIIYIIIAVIVAGAAGFYGGLQYSASRNKNQFSFNSAGSRQNPSGNLNSQVGNRQFGGGFINGEILTKDESSITVKLRDGGSKIILLSDKTTISKSAAGSKDDLAVGANVMVTGATNSDGSLTAESISLRPSLPTPVPMP